MACMKTGTLVLPSPLKPPVKDHDMCGYQLSYFGARYEDALCIDGYLWDLDSGDFEDGFTSGGETPCPSCNTAAFLESRLDDCRCSIAHNQTSSAQMWENVVRFAMKIEPRATAAFLRHMPPVFLHDHAKRVYEEAPADPEDEDFVILTWPWPISGFDKHTQIAMSPRGPSR